MFNYLFINIYKCNNKNDKAFNLQLSNKVIISSCIKFYQNEKWGVERRQIEYRSAWDYNNCFRLLDQLSSILLLRAVLLISLFIAQTEWLSLF